jgi:hypothetical protein
MGYRGARTSLRAAARGLRPRVLASFCLTPATLTPTLERMVMGALGQSSIPPLLTVLRSTQRG